MNYFNLISMLDYAMMAYSDTPTSNVFEKVMFENCEEIGVEYYIGRRGNSLLIAFRGTDSFKDIVTDLNFF